MFETIAQALNILFISGYEFENKLQNYWSVALSSERDLDDFMHKIDHYMLNQTKKKQKIKFSDFLNFIIVVSGRDMHI